MITGKNQVRTLLIDNYDSYTFNLYQMIAQVNGVVPLVIHNDQLKWEELKQLAFDNVVISPGPGRPENVEDFGICSQVLQEIEVPLLGVCLGHQGLGYVYGASVVHTPEIRHGRLSKIYHQNSELFQGIPNPFSAVCYNSLVVADDLPSCLEKTAWTDTGVVMGLHHRHFPFWGVQFHPESICSEYGSMILANFRDITQEFIHQKSAPQLYIPVLDTSLEVDEAKSLKDTSEFQVYSRELDIYPDSEQVFLNLFATEKTAFWLDSSYLESGLSRFSFMGSASSPQSLVVKYHTHNQQLIIQQSGREIKRTESIFVYLRSELARRYSRCDHLPFDFNCGFVGYFGYELKAECGANLVHVSELPDAFFILADRIIAFDHEEKKTYLLYLAEQGEIDDANSWFDLIEKQLHHLLPIEPIHSNDSQKSVILSFQRSQQHYLHDIQTCLQKIYEGESYQVCLTNQLTTDTTPDPLTFYRVLRNVNAAPYSAFLRFGDLAVACSSPERFLRIDAQGWVETKPIKGTVPRGKTPEEDLMLYQQLKNSEKDRSENLMIVDLLRNDLGKVCQVGSIEVPKLMDVETYATVHQLVTTIRGCLRPDMGATDCIQMAFPGGSMTGAPKMRTMEIIDQLESAARGVYSGAIGFLGVNGAADLNIVIRTAILTPNQTSIGVGGGIVALSEPEAEFAEIVLKAQALIQALIMTVHGEFHPDLYQIVDRETAYYC
ncbi:para-aminobenzoate synthase, subunit I [Richelia sinica FACHB-800]|uniref:aminodeoxychorismate synthase n=1 Tax=Richelia sinica FACHB-800 TaxID=1357546 RepID=A0A975TAI1_9NOST|nr:para-aminobenzoate synthase, subunit I [Richelia sinica FACHB-800]